MIQPDKNNQAMPYQIKQFLSLIEEHGLSMDDTPSEGGADEDSSS